MRQDGRYIRKPRVRRPRPAAYHTRTALAPPRPPRGPACSHWLSRPPKRPTRPRCYRWVLTDCAAHPEARCVATQATHRVGTRRTTCGSLHLGLWLRGSTAHKLRRAPASPEKRGLRSLALTRDGAPAACEPSLTYHPLLVCRSCNARCRAATSSKTPRCSKRTRAACSTKLDATSWEGRP